MSDGGPPNSGDDISVVPADVRAVGRYVFYVANALRAALDSAATEVESLLSSGWTGVSANGFASGWTDVHDGGAQIMTALTGMAEKLGVTADSYEVTDGDTSSALGDSSLRL
ncbi:MAG: WXG100 family type VII secretion target [Nocardia sp.]|nr:WXG100 family type VII secretion target [Nocardia sp.]NUS92951.1 WXG100 family type VII secretion target [Nocardia sp.]